jgi:NhaP-type Na+/H+ or K+/H+ antiporter
LVPFILCPAFEEFCYLGEANIAFVIGIVSDPLAANVFSPVRWGNMDNVVLECAQVVLIVQCFAGAVELRNHYVEQHWKSLAVISVTKVNLARVPRALEARSMGVVASRGG